MCKYMSVYVCTVPYKEQSEADKSRPGLLFAMTRHISSFSSWQGILQPLVIVSFFSHDNAYFCFSSWHFSPLGHWRKADLPDTGLLMLMPCDNKNLFMGQWDHFQIVHMNTQCVALVLPHRTGRIVPKKAITQIRSICYDLVINSVLQNCLTFEHCAVQKANWIWH